MARSPADEAAAAGLTPLCMLMMRWGSWPPWIALTMRTLELNPTVSFSIVGDAPPTVLHWPSNCKFVRLSMDAVMRRAHTVLGEYGGEVVPFCKARDVKDSLHTVRPPARPPAAAAAF